MIPVADPGRAVRAERTLLDSALARVLDSNRYVLASEVESFEHELAAYLGVAHCVGVASGTDALELAMRALGCEPGDELVTAANAGFYSSAAAAAAGIQVRYADVDPTTLMLSAATVAPALTESTKVVVVTHLYGQAADVSGILDVCRPREVRVLEDCAQAAGARQAGSLGDASAFSFYPTKNLTALADGGAVATDDASVAGCVRALRQYGWASKYEVASPGGRNSRLDELQAAVLRTRLPLLDKANERRREVVRAYEAALSSRDATLVTRGDDRSAPHLAVLRVEDRDRVRGRLEAAGVGTDVHYPAADHRQPVWGDRYSNVSLPVTEHAVDQVLTLPCYPQLTDDEVAHVAGVLATI
jgi:dTDP-4-amino-4,6-dideoxygalactose transaminase